MQKGICWKRMVLIVLLVISVFVKWTVGTNRVFDRNAQDFIFIIEELEDGQLGFLNDITPFEWDYLYVFSSYTPRSIKQEQMNIDRHLLGSHGTSSLYFLFDGDLVARLFGHGENYTLIVFGQNPIRPVDNLEFLVESRYGALGERNTLRLGSLYRIIQNRN